MLEIKYTLNDLKAVAKQILSHSNTTTFLFKAEMGMGKTTLIKALIETLECKDTVSSPTFSLVNEYKTKDTTIYHMDLYRIQSEAELFDFGIEDYINQKAYFFIEWPELIEPFFDDYHTIEITENENNTRQLKLY